MALSDPQPPLRWSRAAIGMVLLLLLVAGAACLRIYVGEMRHGWPAGSFLTALSRTFFGERFSGGELLSVMDLRVTRLVLAAVVGIALATSGVSLQALLRNPLAEPFILGLSTGAAVGVMGQMMLGFYLGKHLGALHLGAIVGATVSMTVVYLAGRKRGVIDPLGLLLVGVVLGTINGALIMLMRHFYTPSDSRNDVGQWMMGYLNEHVGHGTVLTITALTLSGWGVLMWQHSAMDAAGFSDAEAMSLGVNLGALRKVLFVVGGVLAAGAVVLGGPIAFVGLIAPHLTRLLLGPRHVVLLPGAALIGATLILMADSASTLVDVGQGKMPIGIFTAMIGGPAFLWMLRPHMGRGME